MAETRFTPLTDVAGLDDLLTRSHDAPVVLFLHDFSCPISARAHREMQRLPDEARAAITLVDVGQAHAVKRAVEERTGVRHESPQVILLRGGAAVWDASHFAITAKEVSGALATNA